jgi:long-chain acyl-CoA synthetase
MSGGTTGTPKGVIGTHAGYLDAGLQLRAWLGPALGPSDVILLPLPMFHVYANVGVQSLGLVAGCPLALVPNPRDLADLLATIRRVKPAFFNGVPTLYVALLGHRDVSPARPTSDRSVLGRRTLMAETKQRFEHYRRTNRRGLFAHRSDDGGLRQSGEGTEQDWIGRHAAARRRGSDHRSG